MTRSARRLGGSLASKMSDGLLWGLVRSANRHALVGSRMVLYGYRMLYYASYIDAICVPQALCLTEDQFEEPDLIDRVAS